MANQNQLIERILGFAAIIFGFLIFLIPFLNLGSIPAILIGVYLLVKKRKQIG